MSRPIATIVDDTIYLGSAVLAYLSPPVNIHSLIRTLTPGPPRIAHAVPPPPDTPDRPPWLLAHIGWGPYRPAWLPPEVASFEAAIASLLEATQRCQTEIWWRPTHQDVLSDIPSTLSFFRKHPTFGLALDPAALLTQDMLPRADEHLARILESLGQHPNLRLLILSPSPIAATIEQAVQKSIPPHIPIVQL